MTTPSAPKGTGLANLLNSLADLGVPYAGSISAGEGGKFFCPNTDHEDDRASFDVHIGRNGKPIFTCTPCREAMGQEAFIDVLRSHGVKWSGNPITDENAGKVDFGPAAVVVSPSKEKGSKGEVRLSAVYTYKHADGSPNFKVKRYDPTDGSEARKHFVPQAYHLGSGYKGGRGALDGVERTPYHLDRFEEWIAACVPIYLVEGEKACDALVSAGKAATTFHGGTAGKTEPDWAKRYGFDRFAEVRLWPDADEAGVERMQHLADDLIGAEVSYSFWGRTDAGPKDDAYDVLARGQKPMRLVLDDLDVLKALHPKPVQREGARGVGRMVEVQGVPGVREGLKALLPASGYEYATDEPEGPEIEAEGSIDRPEDAYPCGATQEPYLFAACMVKRHWRSPEGVCTLRFRHDDRTFWRWHPIKRRYDHLSEDDMIALVKRMLSGAYETFMGADGPEIRPIKVKESVAVEIIKHLASHTLTSEYGAGALLPSVGGVPFRNGWLDAETGELLPIGPERDIRWNVPADYDPDAQAPEWLKFLRSLGWTKDTEEYRLLRQWLGYLLSGRKDQERGLLLHGPSRSGKGTILHVGHALLGDGAVGTTLASLTQNFGLQAMIGKGLATIGDARFGKSDKALNGVLLSLTSNDPLPVDVKYGKPLSINLPVRLMIATNETPNFIEASDALGMRFVVLRFEQSFLGREDRGLRARLMQELPGIARWAIGGLADLNDEGKFSETKAGLAMQKQMIVESAFVRLFVEECCVIGEGFRVSNEDLYGEYANWATRNGMPAYNSVRFSRELLDAFPGSISNGSARIDGKVVRCKIGVKRS